MVVFCKPDDKGRYLLLDGHKKRTILLAQGRTTEEVCLLSRDDEAITYNKRVNHVSAMQEHQMIMRAIERGVQETKIAKALNVNLQYIKRRNGLLRQICPEAVHALKEQEVNPVTFDVLRKMKPRRQIEACQLMTSAGNYSSAYAKALLAASRDIDLKDPLGRRPAGPMTCADLALMERELKTVQSDFRAIESAYGEDVLRAAARRRQPSELWCGLVLSNDRHEGAGAWLPKARVRVMVFSNEFGRAGLCMDGWTATPSVEVQLRLAIREASLDPMNSFQNDAHVFLSIHLRQKNLLVTAGRSSCPTRNRWLSNPSASYPKGAAAAFLHEPNLRKC